MMLQTLVTAVLVYALVTAVVLAIVMAVVVRLPITYFSEPQPLATASWTPARIGRNAVGVLLIVAGLIMAVPGVPGQGILTILAGAFITDIPGKRPLERRLIGRGGVLSTLNRIRAWFGKEPLTAPKDAE